MKTESVIKIRPRLKIFRGCPDLTPYLCVFFILLVFFMIGSSFVPVSGIHVDLPIAQTKTTAASKKFIVTVDKNGKMYFNDVMIENMDVLKRHIIEVLSRNSRRTGHREELVIRADGGITLDTGARIMSMAEELNINALFMVSRPKTPSVTVFDDQER